MADYQTETETGKHATSGYLNEPPRSLEEAIAELRATVIRKAAAQAKGKGSLNDGNL